MRLLQLNHPDALIVASAHSRVIQPGSVVDVDEVINPANGAPYTLETALGADLDKFIVAPVLEREPSVVEAFEEATLPDGALPESVEETPLIDTDDPAMTARLQAAVVSEIAPAPAPKAAGRGRKK